MFTKSELKLLKKWGSHYYLRYQKINFYKHSIDRLFRKLDESLIVEYSLVRYRITEFSGSDYSEVFRSENIKSIITKKECEELSEHEEDVFYSIEVIYG